MRKVLLLATILSLLFCGSSLARAQESSDAKTPKPQPIEAYRLDFSFNELEGEKKINTRHYSMNLTSGDPNEIKIGSRVPVTTGFIEGNQAGTQYQYVDVGTRIWAVLKHQDDEEELQVRSEVSNLDLTAQAGSIPNQAPVIRQIKIDGSTLLTLGKPLLIGSMDDPNSKRQFQLEVTVTKLR